MVLTMSLFQNTYPTNTNKNFNIYDGLACAFA